MDFFSLIFSKETDSMSFEVRKKRYLFITVLISLIFLIMMGIMYFFIGITSIYMLFFVAISIVYYNRRCIDLYREYNKLDKLKNRVIITTFLFVVFYVILFICIN